MIHYCFSLLHESMVMLVNDVWINAQAVRPTCSHVCEGYVERSSCWNRGYRRVSRQAASFRERLPPKRAQAVARRLVIGGRVPRRRRRARKAAGFPANNAKWCICQGEFVHRRRRRRRRRAPRSSARFGQSLATQRSKVDRGSAIISPPAAATTTVAAPHSR